MPPVKIFNESITLGSNHALIIPHKPEKLNMGMINTKLESEPQDLSSLGLFDSSSPNYTTYYPDVTEADLNPKDSEFVEPVFRMLSNVTVAAPYNPIHFPADVLKKSMYKLIGQTVFVDHEMSTGNAIGSVKSVEWQDSYMSNGIKVPAGINAVLKIDGKSNPRLARAIMMDPPAVHSNSVTVNFAWKKSHEKLSDEEFRDKLGSFDEKGKLIQKIATNVKAYFETSLVSHGADPFAQKVGKDGKIVNPKFAGSRYTGEEKPNKQTFSWDWKSADLAEVHEETVLNSTTILETINYNQNSKNMEDILKALEKFFGLEEGTLTEENYKDQLEGINFLELKVKAEAEPEPIKVLDLEGVEAIENEITGLRDFKSKVPEDYQAKMALSEFGLTTLEELRAETGRLYGLTVEEGKEDPNILGLIKDSDHKILKSLFNQYYKTTEGKFTFSCTSCGSHDVTRASAAVGGEEEEFVERSKEEVMDHYTGVHAVKLPAWMKVAAGS